MNFVQKLEPRADERRNPNVHCVAEANAEDGE